MRLICKPSKFQKEKDIITSDKRFINGVSMVGLLLERYAEHNELVKEINIMLEKAGECTLISYDECIDFYGECCPVFAEKVPVTDIPELVGSEKQILWATKIRDKVMKQQPKLCALKVKSHSAFWIRYYKDF